MRHARGARRAVTTAPLDTAGTNKLGQWLGGGSELQRATLTRYASLLDLRGLVRRDSNP